jgi:hypothetical protein
VDDFCVAPLNHSGDPWSEVHCSFGGKTSVPSNYDTVLLRSVFTSSSFISSDNRHIMSTVRQSLGNLLDMVFDTPKLWRIPRSHL